jgi:predicted DNA-binding transcriptional regulator YafY
MSRAARLLDLLQALRRRRVPVSGAELAAELGVSLRTIYRDIATLQAQGADISGEAGLGYLLHPGFTLPPLMLTHDEVEALMLGMAWVADRGDGGLQAAARDVLAKVEAVLPAELRSELGDASMLVGPGTWATHDDVVYTRLRTAIRGQRRLALAYRDQQGAATRRIVWPCAVALFDQMRIVVAWCELRGSFRHFRVDRIVEVEVLVERYPRTRSALLQEWRAGMAAEGRGRRTDPADRN